jgi:hypothetical protein
MLISFMSKQNDTFLSHVSCSFHRTLYLSVRGVVIGKARASDVHLRTAYVNMLVTWFGASGFEPVRHWQCILYSQTREILEKY